jgi:hypothetical protein
VKETGSGRIIGGSGRSKGSSGRKKSVVWQNYEPKRRKCGEEELRSRLKCAWMLRCAGKCTEKKPDAPQRIRLLFVYFSTNTSKRGFLCGAFEVS